MKKIILAIIINLLCFLNYGNAQVKSENITFPTIVNFQTALL